MPRHEGILRVPFTDGSVLVFRVPPVDFEVVPGINEQGAVSVFVRAFTNIEATFHAAPGEATGLPDGGSPLTDRLEETTDGRCEAETPGSDPGARWNRGVQSGD